MERDFRMAAGFSAVVLVIFLVSACRTTAPTADRAGDTAADTTAADTTAWAAGIIPREIPRTVPARARPVRARTSDVDLDTVRAGRFDQGKMWTFEYPPIEYFAETYNFRPDEAWFERARLGALRIPGCTASFISPNGLVLTNHHCGRGHATSVSEGDENILDNGFYADELGEERRVEGMWADQLVEIRDVTNDVEAAVTTAETDAERMQARSDAVQAIQARIQEEMGEDYLVQIISLYNGGLYSGYIFRRYTDVRLVMIPELAVGFFGGDPDNFTYPRYTLDMSFFRIYEDGDPVHTQHFFPLSEEGVQEDDAVFVIGNPGSTFRLSTVAELAFRRDVQEPAILNLIDARLEALQAYLPQASAEEEDALRNEIFSLQNAQKLYRGRVEALNDPIIFARREDAEKNFVAAIADDPGLTGQYGGLVDSMAAVQQAKTELANEFRAFLSLNPQSSLAAAVLRRAVLLYPFVQQNAPEATRDQVLAQLALVQDQPEPIQERYLTQRFQDFVAYFGASSELVQGLLQGRTPAAAAADVVSNSALVTASSAQEAVDAGKSLASDPAIQAVGAFYPRLADFRSAMAGISSREQSIARELGRARFDVYGTDVPPDATFSLRIADGVVRGYPYNGTVAPPYTTMYGVYDRHFSHGPGTPWDLPESWLPPPPGLDLKTPINFVSTNDSIGGNSGSPVVNTSLQLVGLLFDGNIESLAGDFIYMTDRARSVSVDARGILEALRDVYEAERLVLEATTGQMVESDTEAQEQLSE